MTDIDKLPPWSAGEGYADHNEVLIAALRSRLELAVRAFDTEAVRADALDAPRVSAMFRKLADACREPS